MPTYPICARAFGVCKHSKLYRNRQILMTLSTQYRQILLVSGKLNSSLRLTTRRGLRSLRNTTIVLRHLRPLRVVNVDWIATTIRSSALYIKSLQFKSKQAKYCIIMAHRQCYTPVVYIDKTSALDFYYFDNNNNKILPITKYFIIIIIEIIKIFSIKK